MAIDVIWWRDARQASSIMDGWSDGKPVPWVRAGNLYLSMLRTGGGDMRYGGGEGAWPEIVNYVIDKSKGKTPPIMVLTGRHGAIFGGFQPGGGVTEAHVDPKHTEEDMKQVEFVKKAHPGLNIGVIDAGRFTKDELQWITAEAIQKDVTVIYAWCHSLFTMYEVDYDQYKGSAPPALKQEIKDWKVWGSSKDEATATLSAIVAEVEENAGKKQSNKTILTITTESYSWVPNLINSSVRL